MFAKRKSEVRRPAVAGAFYPRGAQELKSTVEALLSQTTKRCFTDQGIRNIKGHHKRAEVFKGLAKSAEVSVKDSF
jgi:predicted class III extradiol MEMO1 family dioxygenase